MECHSNFPLFVAAATLLISVGCSDVTDPLQTTHDLPPAAMSQQQGQADSVAWNGDVLEFTDDGVDWKVVRHRDGSGDVTHADLYRDNQPYALLDLTRAGSGAVEASTLQDDADWLEIDSYGEILDTSAGWDSGGGVDCEQDPEHPDCEIENLLTSEDCEDEKEEVKDEAAQLTGEVLEEVLDEDKSKKEKAIRIVARSFKAVIAFIDWRSCKDEQGDPGDPET